MFENRMDKTGYFDALTAYSKNPTQEIPPILEQYLNGIAKNGETAFHWPLLKPLIFGKMEQVIEEMRKELSSETIPERPNVENIPFDVMHSRIMEALHKFNGAPFTIQRLCEMLIDPKRHYKRSDKFLRGLEKNVLVVSTVDPFGRKVVSESGGKHLVNGMDTCVSPFFTRDSSIASNLPPVPDWVSMAASPQNSPASDLSERKQTQPVSQDPTVTTNEVSGGLEGSKYTDQEKEALPEHTEKDTNKTAVAMDTSEAVSAAKEGQDTLVEGEEECLGGDETSASSSSSEELSSSDTSESSDAAANEASTAESHVSPWALAVSEGNNEKHAPSSDLGLVSGNATSPSDKPEQSLEAPPETDSSLPSQTDAHSACTKDADTDEQLNTVMDSNSPESSSDVLSSQQDSLNDSTGFDNMSVSVEKTNNSLDEQQDSSGLRLEAENVHSSTVRSESDGNDSRNERQECVNDDSSIMIPESENGDTNNLISESDSNNSNSMTPEFVKDDSSCMRPESECDDSNIMESESDSTDLSIVRPDSAAGNDKVPVSPVSSAAQCHQSSSSSISSYEEVVASSTADAVFKNIPPLDSIAECDNVAGLERLVDSVDPSPSSPLTASSSSSSPLHPLTAPRRGAELLSPSADSSSHSEEPQAKRRKISDESFSPLTSNEISNAVTTSSPSEEESSSSDYSSTSDVVADTTSDSVSKNLTSSLWDPSTEAQESVDIVTCSGSDSVDLEDVDYTTKEDRDNVASPPSQLSSSSDSQGFDVTSATGVSTEEKDVTESVMDEEHQQEMVEDKSSPENESIPEPLVHD